MRRLLVYPVVRISTIEVTGVAKDFRSRSYPKLLNFHDKKSNSAIMEARNDFRTDYHIYILDRETSPTIKHDEFFVQLDGGNSKPILRKYVTDQDYQSYHNNFGSTLADIYHEVGYYPYSNEFDSIMGTRKIIASTNELDESILSIPDEFSWFYCKHDHINEIEIIHEEDGTKQVIHDLLGTVPLGQVKPKDQTS